MEIFNSMFTGMGELLVWPLPLWFALGVLNGLVFGLLPGLSGSVGIALMVFPYFVTSTVLLVAVGVGLIAVPYFVRI